MNRKTLLRGGTMVRHCDDDAVVKALAIRLGVYSQIVTGLREVGHVKRPASAALCRDGDTLHAIVLLSGWDDPKDNGWVAMSASPVSPEGAALLERFARTAISGAANTRFEEAQRSWPN